MSGSRLDIMLALLALGLFVVSGRRVQDAVSFGRGPAPVVGRAAPLPSAADRDSLSAHEAMIIDNDIFRLSNQPSTVPFLLAPPPDSDHPETPQPLLPTLTVRAIMGGPPWLAVIDGLPGQTTGITVRAGDSFQNVVVRSVGRDTVVVQSPDTTWKLTISRRP